MSTNTTKDITKRKRIVRFFYDPAKEEAWLQEMADKGWALEKVTFVCYTFRQCPPNTYIVKNALAENRGEKAAIEEMLADSGAIICPLRWNDWPAIYAIRDKSLGEFEINSTADSKARSDLLWLKTIRTLLITIFIIAICLILEGIFVGTTGIFEGSSIDAGFFFGSGVGVTIPALLFLPVYLRVRKRFKGYKDDSGIYAT